MKSPDTDMLISNWSHNICFLDEPLHFDENASAAPLILVYVNKKSIKRHFTEFYNNKGYAKYDFLLRQNIFLDGKTSDVL